ncbi:MAG TPA: hypothetical protein HPQ00_06990, partial [Magnetococcales bacterium]|nr:hypothetical protein [Magnetococcales bacterium]
MRFLLRLLIGLLSVPIISVAANDVPVLRLVSEEKTLQPLDGPVDVSIPKDKTNSGQSDPIDIISIAHDQKRGRSVFVAKSPVSAFQGESMSRDDVAASSEPIVADQQPMDAATVTLRSETQGQEARLILSWVGEVNFSKRLKGRELVMVFEKPFVPQGMDAAIQKLFAWLGDVRYGYDSLLLRANQAGTGFHVTASGNDVVIVMTLPPPSPELLEQRRVEDARMRFLKAKTMVSTRTMYGARMRLRAMVEESPKNVEFLGEFGTLEDQLGRWRQAVALYDRGLTEASGEPNIIFAKALLHHNHGPFIQTSGGHKRSSKDNESQDSQDVDLLLVGSQGMDLDLKFRRVDLEIENVTDAQGLIGNKAVEWYSGSAAMAMSWPDADTSRLGLLAGDDQWGLTLSHDFFHSTAKTRFLADWRRPFGGT